MSNSLTHTRPGSSSHGNPQDQLRVHSIESFGTHDGPGIRMVIFVQGCQFQCLYCANPDTIPIEGGNIMAIPDLVQQARNEQPYFGKKGGVTVSGGEPLLQRTVLTQLFQQLHQHGIHTALDSNGRLLDQEAKALLDETDLLLLDIKHMDDDWHHRLTGVSNQNTLQVARYREASQKPFWVRHVLVPGWTDQPWHLHQLGEFLAPFQMMERLELEPYHQLGVHKWASMGKQYQLEEVIPPSEEDIEKAVEILTLYVGGVKVK